MNIRWNMLVGGTRMRLTCGCVGAGEFIAAVGYMIGVATCGTEFVAVKPAKNRTCLF